MKSESQAFADVNGSVVTLRRVEPADDEFLFEVYASTRADELAAAGWADAQKEAFLRSQFAAQQQHYRGRFPGGEHQVIVRDGRPIGRVYVAGSDDEIRILDISLLPQDRSAGVGTALLKKIMARAEKAGKPARIYVENYNRSVGLFERLGFRRVEDTGAHYLLEWRPG